MKKSIKLLVIKLIVITIILGTTLMMRPVQVNAELDRVKIESNEGFKVIKGDTLELSFILSWSHDPEAEWVVSDPSVIRITGISSSTVSFPGSFRCSYNLAIAGLKTGESSISLVGKSGHVFVEDTINVIEDPAVIQKVIEAVEKSEKSKIQEDVDLARDLVNNLSKSSEKTLLLERLDAVQDIIDERFLEEAREAVEKAEKNKIQEDVDIAKSLVDKLKSSSEKTLLLERLETVQDIIDEKSLEEAVAAVEKAEKSKIQEDVDIAKSLVDKLKNSSEKTSLIERLSIIDIFIQRETKYNIKGDKEWTVEFNLPLDKSSVKEENIYVTDSTGKDVLVSYKNDQEFDEKIHIVPVKDYISGETYTLWIKDLIAEDGTVLSKNVKMNFTIK